MFITAGGGWRGRGGEWKAMGQRSIFVNYGRWVGVGLRSSRNPAGEGWRERAGGRAAGDPYWPTKYFC